MFCATILKEFAVIIDTKFERYVGYSHYFDDALVSGALFVHLWRKVGFVQVLKRSPQIGK